MGASNERESDPLAADVSDQLVTAARMILSGLAEVPLVGTGSALALEAMPSAAERQHARALRTLWRLMHELQDVVSAHDWRDAAVAEDFDAAVIRSVRAAEEADAEEKRELIWYGLINGWVRTHGDPERDRFLRLVAKYGLEHFQILEKIQATVGDRPSWSSVEGKLLKIIGGDRFAARAYVHEFHSDGLLRTYDQPEMRRGEQRSIYSKEIALWTDTADRLLEFVKRPVRGMNAVDSDA